jgi:hypothetical protein
MMLFYNWNMRMITSLTYLMVRAEVPKLKLDDVFERKDDIAIV